MKPPLWSDAKAAARRLQAPAAIVGGKREVWAAFIERNNCPPECKGCPHTMNGGVTCNHPGKPVETVNSNWRLE